MLSQWSWGISSGLCDVALNKTFSSCHRSSLEPAAFLSRAAEGQYKGSTCDKIEAVKYYFLFNILRSITDYAVNEA